MESPDIPLEVFINGEPVSEREYLDAMQFEQAVYGRAVIESNFNEATGALIMNLITYSSEAL